MRYLVLAFALAACNPLSPFNNHNNDKTGVDLCTSPACADSPCTPGCIFQAKSGGCPCDAPSSIAASRVTACSNRCGLRDHSGDELDGQAQGGYCWKLDRTASGCDYDQPGCHEYNAACYPSDNSFQQGGASICGSDETCNDGATLPPDDMAVACDMAPPPDLTSIPDLATATDLAKQSE